MKTILITGGSSGIGAALAVELAAPGITMALTGRDAGRLADVAERCRARGAKVEAVSLDVADRGAMETWIADFDDAYGGIDTVVANAGVGGGGGREPTPENLAAARTMFATNIDGVLNTIDPVLPRMAARGGGQVVLMASLAGFRGMPGAPAYAASKGFVKLYGEGLRGAMAPHGIKVNVVCPGFVDSRITLQNDFPMPFFMQADEAARIIAQGMKKNRARIAFPWPMVFAVWLFSVLPADVSEFIVRLLPKKS